MSARRAVDTRWTFPEATTSAIGITELTGRILLSVLFLASGIEKIGAYAATAEYMSSFGVPGSLLPLVIATEILGALAIIVGWKTRFTAFVLAGFSLAAATLFHSSGDPAQTVHYLKNLSIAGGFLLLVVHGAGPFSLDGKLRG